MRGIRVFLTSGALSLALAACGGDGGGDDTPITELSGDDLVSLCEDVNDIRLSDDEFVQIVCNISGIMAGEQGGDCEATITACLADPPEQEPPQDCSTAADDEVPDCPDVTVGDFLDCQQAQIDQLRTGTDLTCGDDYGPILNELPVECTEILEKCPELGGEATRIVPPSALEQAAALSQAIAR